MTDQTITDQQLDEYDELCAAATPGPWAHTDSSAIVAPLSADKIADVWEPTGLSRNGDFIETARTAMPALIAKVRRLQARVAELEEERRLEWLRQGVTPHTPRICECGHSHHAHTVPDPHSCFAHGQTCPCPAYRQMSHDDAVAHQTRKQAEYAAASAAGESGSTR